MNDPKDLIITILAILWVVEIIRYEIVSWKLAKIRRIIERTNEELKQVEENYKKEC